MSAPLSRDPFPDHFSGIARTYRQYRPGYPSELFEWLAANSPGRGLAWDCGTGNGQAAHALARHFDRVLATDASEEQLALAGAHPRIEYRHAAAEAVVLPPESVDLITAAASAHWFVPELFHERVRSALVPGGLVAFWTYHLPTISPELDAIVKHYTHTVLGSFWPEGARHVLADYRTLALPYPAEAVPDFRIETRWSFEELLGFLGSWSAGVEFEKATGRVATGEIEAELGEAWGSAGARSVEFQLHLRVGRKRG